MRKEGQVEIRIVSAAWGELPKNKNSEVVARNQILKWAAKRTKEEIPERAYEGKDFELALGNGEVISGAGLWAFKFDTADDTFREAEGIERRWRTEVVIAKMESAAAPLFSVRLSVVTARSGFPFIRSAPALIREIGRSPGIVFPGAPECKAGVPVNQDEFIRFLERRDRRPVIAISENFDYSSQALAGEIERGVIGFGHVIRVDESLSWHLTRTLGKRWSVFDGGVRIYFPGLNPELQTSFYHPGWKRFELPKSQEERRRFVSRIQRRLYSESAVRSDLDDVAPGFLAADVYLRSVHLADATKQVAQAKERAQFAVNDAERLAAAENQVSALIREGENQRREIELLKKQLDASNQERDYAYEVTKDYEEEIGRIKSQFHAALGKVDSLSSALAKSGAEIEQDVDFPDRLDEMSDWAEKYFSDRLVITAKAVRAAKKSVYEDVGHLYKCLQLLAVEYCDMRRSGLGDAYRARSSELRVEVSDAGVSAANHRYKQQYEFSYNGGYEIADLHLCPAKGTAERGSVDPRRSYRIYFYWDEELKMVVIASLPGHLNTTLTN
ncbi:hypothetical protein [Xanthomonas sacchari]|uniref:hypothetical protein n=1 Tax=Xanthomonas sacchari TaxID=56458 RepID=UPI003B21B99F